MGRLDDTTLEELYELKDQDTAAFYATIIICFGIVQ